LRRFNAESIARVSGNQPLANLQNQAMFFASVDRRSSADWLDQMLRYGRFQAIRQNEDGRYGNCLFLKAIAKTTDLS